MTSSTHLPPSALEDWLQEAATLLGVDRDEVPVSTVLDVARDVAHGVVRPAAPLTTFLLGLAIGRAREGDLHELARAVTKLAETWNAGEEPPQEVDPGEQG